MTKKQEQAIRTLYKDGITCDELDRAKVSQDKCKIGLLLRFTIII